jgi:hypothetical protein
VGRPNLAAPPRAPQVPDEGRGAQVSEARVSAALGRAAASGNPGGGSPPPSPPSGGSGGRNPFGAEARLDLSSRLKLDQIRVQLLRQEDNILFGWVKRSAYRRNAPVYQPGGMKEFLPNDTAMAQLSLLTWHLQQTEARRRRQSALALAKRTANAACAAAGAARAHPPVHIARRARLLPRPAAGAHLQRCLSRLQQRTS